MTVPSPLHDLIAAEAKQAPVAAPAAERPGADSGAAPLLECAWLPWGPEGTGGTGIEGGPPLLLATLGSMELEYAALRRGIGRLDAVVRGTISVTGADRLDFLDRLLTQKLAGLPVGTVVEAFLIERTGKLLADLVVVHGDTRTLLDVDVHQIPIVCSTLEAMCFGEDVQIENCTAAHHRIEVHGPAALEVSGAMGFALDATGSCAEHGQAVAWRLDRIGAPGVAWCVPTDAAAPTWAAIEQVAVAAGKTCRTIGWYAFNMARVEAGEPVANIDFGTGNLPAETGLLHRRVSFEKGCYPGQEVVARMHNLGHPKQVLRRLVLPDTRLPVAGAQVFAGDDADLAQPRGAVTSSAPAPLSSQRAVALAMLRWAVAEPGGTVQVMAEGEPIEAAVEEIGAP